MRILLYAIFSTLLAGSLAVLRDLPVVNGTVLASGAGERLSVRYLWPLVLLAGLVCPCLLTGEPLTDAAESIFKPSTATEILPVGLATAIAVIVAGRFGRYVAVPFAFMASIAGLSLAGTGHMSVVAVRSHVFSWMAAPILCALLAAGIYRIYALTLKNERGISMITSVILLVAFSVN